MKDFLKGISSTTLVIIYLFVCGGLYLIGFWQTFNIDVSAFVDTWDIPKSFIFPFMISTGFWLFNQFLGLVLYSESKSKELFDSPNKLNDDREGRNLFHWKEVIKRIFSFESITFYAIAFIPYFYFLYKMEVIFLGLSGLLVGYKILYQLNKFEPIRKAIPTYFIRNLILTFVIFTPITSFVAGKVLSLNIYHNKDIMCLTNINAINATINQVPLSTSRDTTCLKFLGFLGNKVIISSLDNKRIEVINQSNFAGFELIKK